MAAWEYVLERLEAGEFLRKIQRAEPAWRIGDDPVYNNTVTALFSRGLIEEHLLDENPCYFATLKGTGPPKFDDVAEEPYDGSSFHQRMAIMMKGRWPIQISGGGYSNETIPWEVAVTAYKGYVKKYGRQQTMWRLGERGGFAPEELDRFYPEWREKVEELDGSHPLQNTQKGKGL